MTKAGTGSNRARNRVGQNGFRVVLRLLVGFHLAVFGVTSAWAQESTPRYVIYYNADASPPETLIGTPYTHVILSFVTVGPDVSDEGPVSLVVPGKIEPALDLIERF